MVTAFLIETYQWLSEDPIEALLTRISSQLDPVANSPSLKVPFTPSTSNIAINTVWFSSLIIALSAVLTAILVKQWLFHYTWTNNISILPPHLAIGLRYLSLASMNKDHGHVIYHAVAFPPLLLIVSLFLFFAGLITLLWTLNYIVAGVITFLTSLTVIYFLATTIAPAFNRTSVYRSTQAWKFYRLVSAWRFIYTGGKTRNAKTWTDMSLECLEGPDSVGHLSRALLWIHDHAVERDFSCIQSVWKCAKSLDEVTALQVLCGIYLNDTSKSRELNILSKAYTELWRCWIGEREMEDMYELLLHTFPDNSLASTNPESHHLNHIVAFCSLHFGIEYHFGRAVTILTGLNKLCDLLSPTDVRLQSLVTQDGTSSIADIKEGIAYTINFSIMEHWSEARPSISAANTVGNLGKQFAL